MRPLVALLVLTLVVASCTKREFNLSEDTPLTGTLDPVFAVPLVHGTWSFGEVMDAIEIPATLETDATGVITAVFPFDAFETAPIPLVPLSESADALLNLDAEQAAALSLLPAGAEFDVNFSNLMELPMPDLTEVDSVWLGGGVLVVQIESALPLAIAVLGTCNNLLVDGQALTVELSMDPVSAVLDVLIPMSDATLLGSGGDGVSLEWDWSAVLTSTGQPVEAGEALTLQTAFEGTTVVGAFGKFSAELSHDIEARMPLPELTSWDPALFYLSSPRLVLEVKNSFGVDLGMNITELALLTGSEASSLTGPAIEDFPVLTGALTLGDTAWTSHVLDNEGLNPDLSDVLNAAPDSLQLLGSVEVLPPSAGGQFVTATDVLTCTGALEVPLSGWARGVTWKDTLNAPISQDLQAGVAPPLDWMDVASLTLRFIVDNGWPLDLNGSVTFINAEGDSLLAGPGLSIPGASNASAVTIVDYTLERPLALELMEMECAGVAVAWTLATTGADAGQSVEVYAQDAMSMRIAAKVECQIDPTP